MVCCNNDIDRSKIGFSGHGNIEIIDLKDIPGNMERRIDGKNYFRTYHMNKRHWYAICLDGRAPDENIKSLIHVSYNLVKGKKHVKSAGNERQSEGSYL